MDIIYCICASTETQRFDFRACGLTIDRRSVSFEFTWKYAKVNWDIWKERTLSAPHSLWRHRHASTRMCPSGYLLLLFSLCHGSNTECCPNDKCPAEIHDMWPKWIDIEGACWKSIFISFFFSFLFDFIFFISSIVVRMWIGPVRLIALKFISTINTVAFRTTNHQHRINESVPT